MRYYPITRIPSSLFSWVLCLSLVLTGIESRAQEPEESMSPEWLSAGVALEKAVQKLQPVFVVLELDSDEETRVRLQKVLSDSAVEKSLKDLICLKESWSRENGEWRWRDHSAGLDGNQRNKENSARKVLEKLLRSSSGKSVVAVFDPYLNKGTLFSYSKLRASNFRKAIRTSLKLSEGYRRARVLGEKLLDRAQGFVQDARHPDSLRTLAKMDEFRFPPNEPLLDRRAQLMEILEKRWKEARAEARDLELSNKLAEAAAKLEVILKEYPHPEWEKQIREDIGRVWRRIQGPGGGTPNS